MSGKKASKPQQTKTEEPGIVISEGFSGLKHSKKLGLVIAAALVVFCVVLLWWLQKSDTPRDTNTAAKTAKVITDAHADVVAGNFTKAETNLQQALDDATSTEEKAKLELSLAEVTVNDGDYVAAVTHAQASNKYSPSAAAYGIIGFASKQQGKWRNALDAYTQAAAMSRNASDSQQATYYDSLATEAKSYL